MQIVGHKKQIGYLDNILKNKQALPHAFLFFGPDKIGKKTIALEFIKSIQCDKSNQIGRLCGDCAGCRQPIGINADFLFIKSSDPDDGKEIGIASIRELKSFMGSKPLHGGHKIAVIDQADNMTQEAQNALLKILEEPSGDKLFFLSSSNPDKLLKTIVSRVCAIKFSFVSQEEVSELISSIGASKSTEIESLLPVIGNRPGMIFDLMSNPEVLKDRIKIIDDFFKFAGSGINERFNYIEKASKSEDFNLGFLLENWMMILRLALFKKVQTCDLIDEDDLLYEFVKMMDKKAIARALRVANNVHSLSAGTNVNQRLAFEIFAINL